MTARRALLLFFASLVALAVALIAVIGWALALAYPEEMYGE